MAKAKAIAEIKDNAVYVLQAGTPTYVKTADICAMTGKTNQWIGQLVSQGVLSKKQTAHGALFELTSTVRAYCNMLESRGSESPEEQAQEKARRSADLALKKAKATIAAIEAKERSGQMHRSEDVAAMTEDLILFIRNSLLALPGRLAIDITSANDSAEVETVIKSEVCKILEELSNYRYDPSKYKERVRARLNLSPDNDLNDYEEI